MNSCGNYSIMILYFHGVAFGFDMLYLDLVASGRQPNWHKLKIN